MASNLGVQSVRLDQDIYSLGEEMRRDPAIRNRGPARLGRLFMGTKDTLEDMRGLIADITFLSQVKNDIEKTKKIFQGLRVMRDNPNAFHSVDRYLAWDKIMKGRRSDARKRQVEVQDAVRSKLDPTFAHKLSLSRLYGSDGADAILSAERESARRKGVEETAERKAKGRFNYTYDTMSDAERRRWDNTIRYGGGAQGRMYADAIEQENENRALHETKGRIASRNRQLTAKMMKEFPIFFANSKRSTKDIKAIAKGIKTIEKFPFGKVLTSALRNPAAAAITGVTTGLTIANGILSKSDSANTHTTKWANAMNLYGTPSKEFVDAAKAAGIEDPAEIARRYGEAMFKFGNADNFYRGIGQTFAESNSRVKMGVANEIGFDAAAVMMAEIMSGKGGKHLTEDRVTQGKKIALEWQKIKGWSSGSGFDSTMRALELTVPTQLSAEARGYSGIVGSLKILPRIVKFLTNPIGSAVDKAVDASKSALIFESEMSSSGNAKQINISVGGITITKEEAQNTSFWDMLNKGTDDMFSSALESMDSKVK